MCFLLLCYCRYFYNLHSNASSFSFWFYLVNSQVNVYRTIGPLVSPAQNIGRAVMSPHTCGYDVTGLDLI